MIAQSFNRYIAVCAVSLGVFFGSFGSHTFAQDAALGETQAASVPLKVGTKEAPPFAMRGEDGKWTGLSIELWERIARRIQRDFKLVSFDSIEDLLAACESGDVDVGVAAATITAEREEVVDFSHPFYNSGLAIAVSEEHAGGFLGLFRALTSPTFLATIGTLLTLLFVTGAIIWWVERKENVEQFDEDAVKGIGNGFWWSAVTMTTVGYGDKAPKTPLGRAIAIVWMFAALIITAVFTAQLASSLTADRISGPVANIGDLSRARVGVVDGASSNEYFSRKYLPTRKYADVNAGLAALEDEKIDAFVHDEPILRYTVRREFGGQLKILSQIFEEQDYGIILPQNSKARDLINQVLLKVVTSDEWVSLRAKYFGEDQ